MKQPTKLMKGALRRSKDHEWDKSYLGQTMRETVIWTNVSGSVKVVPHPDPTQRIRIHTENMTITYART